jgi:hypothetical protein
VLLAFVLPLKKPTEKMVFFRIQLQTLKISQFSPGRLCKKNLNFTRNRSLQCFNFTH